MMNQTNLVTVIIDDKPFDLEYYSQFENYYSQNGKLVEVETRSWFLNELKSTDVIFDIGAHIGLYTILFSQRTNNVISFEPTETYDKLLVPNLKRNNIKTPKLEKLALGIQSGFKKDKIFRIWGNPAEELEYNFTTLDEYIFKNNINPTFIKIDVDSFDYEVLLGGQEYLSSNDVIVCVEISHALSYRGHNPDKIKNLMFNMGYKIINTFDFENVIFKK